MLKTFQYFKEIHLFSLWSQVKKVLHNYFVRFNDANLCICTTIGIKQRFKEGFLKLSYLYSYIVNSQYEFAVILSVSIRNRYEDLFNFGRYYYIRRFILSMIRLLPSSLPLPSKRYSHFSLRPKSYDSNNKVKILDRLQVMLITSLSRNSDRRARILIILQIVLFNYKFIDFLFISDI